MRGSHHFLSDAARLFGSVGQLVGAGKAEADDFIKLRLQNLLDEMQLVRRDEFEAVKEMAIKALEENKRLREELHDLKSQNGTGKKS